MSRIPSSVPNSGRNAPITVPDDEASRARVAWSPRMGTELANAHAALDRAVWAAYGWPADEVPAEVAEDVILTRLPARR
jgi:hypothetical protein